MPVRVCVFVCLFLCLCVILIYLRNGERKKIRDTISLFYQFGLLRQRKTQSTHVHGIYAHRRRQRYQVLDILDVRLNVWVRVCLSYNRIKLTKMEYIEKQTENACG